MAQQAVLNQPNKALANNYFQPEELVFTFDHYHQAKAVGDEEVKGFASAKRYYHILTPIQQNSDVMYRFQLKGYAMVAHLHWILFGVVIRITKYHSK
eukprot:819112_1